MDFGFKMTNFGSFMMLKTGGENKTGGEKGSLVCEAVLHKLDHAQAAQDKLAVIGSGMNTQGDGNGSVFNGRILISYFEES